MSVDSGEPRQRTVAELLAANGGQQPGRRRRRRASEDEVPAGAPVAAGHGGPEAPAAPRRPVPADRVRPPAPPEAPGGFAPRGGDGPGAGEHPSFPPARRPDPSETPRGPEAPFVPNGNAPRGNGVHPGRAGAAAPVRPQAPEPQGPPNGRPWGRDPYAPDAYGQDPHGPDGYARAPYGAEPHGDAYGGEPYGDPYGAEPYGDPYARDPRGPRGPEGFAARAPEAPRPAPWGPPPGADEVADEIPTSRLGARRPSAPADDDGGPPTQFGAPPLDDDDATGRHPARPYPGDGGPVTGAYDPFADDDHDADPGRTGVLAPERPGPAPDGYDDYEDHGELDGGAVEDDEPARRRFGRRGAVEDSGAQPPAGLGDEAPTGAAGTGQGWAVVIGQWIGGAVAGAAIWVLFRFLWTSLPVVAIVAAVAITVGLVLGVRALLRHDDLRTTLFAVMVGLLLTVSPAILVLLDR